MIETLQNQLTQIRDEHRTETEKEGGAVVFEGFSNEHGLFVFTTRTLWHETQAIDPNLAQDIREGKAFIDDHPEHFIEIDTWKFNGTEFAYDPEMVNKINSPDHSVHADEHEFFSTLQTYLNHQASATLDAPAGP